jgi:tripartite-type tricarboxylate transporter receptor subunit TctC
MRCKIRLIAIFVPVLTIALFGTALSQANAEAHSFQGQTITILCGRRPGGSGDMQARAVIPFL